MTPAVGAFHAPAVGITTSAGTPPDAPPAHSPNPPERSNAVERHHGAQGCFDTSAHSLVKNPSAEITNQNTEPQTRVAAGPGWVQFGFGDAGVLELVQRSSEPQYDQVRYQIGYTVADLAGRVRSWCPAAGWPLLLLQMESGATIGFTTAAHPPLEGWSESANCLFVP